MSIAESDVRKGMIQLIEAFRSEYRLVGEIWRGHYPSHPDILPISPLERTVMIMLVVLRSLSLSHLCSLSSDYRSASHFSETYVLVRFAALIVIFVLSAPHYHFVYAAIVIYCLADGLNYRLTIIFVDRYANDWGLRSLNRSLILLFINYAELIVGFASLYLISVSIGSKENVAVTPVASHLDALYFSVVTITTTGFGDITPINSIGKSIMMVEALAGVVLIVLVIGTFLTGVNNIRNLTREQGRLTGIGNDKRV